MGKINSRAKGAAGERELASYLREQGWQKARRSVQYAGNPEGGSNPVVLSADTALVDGGIVSRNGYVYTTPKGIYSQNEDVYAGHGEIVSRNGDVYSGSNGVVVANGDVFAGSGITYVTVMGLSAKMRKP